MSLNERVRREDVLFRLLGALPGAEFGTGRPACHTASDAPAEQREAMAELFFPVSERAEQQVKRAKEICQSCPVQGSCLQFALRTGEDHGVWGGLTASERRRLRAARVAGEAEPAEVSVLDLDLGDEQDGPGEVAA